MRDVASPRGPAILARVTQPSRVMPPMMPISAVYGTSDTTGRSIDLTTSLKCDHSVAAHISVWAWP